MGLKCPNWMPTGRWSWTICCRAGFKRSQLPGSCTLLIPVAQNSRDNSGTSPSDLFLQLIAKWQQRPETPALIRRIHTSSSHHAPHQCSDSAEEWIKPRSNHPLRRRTAPPATPVAANSPAPLDHPSDEGVFKSALSLKGGSQNEQPHPHFHQQPGRLQKKGVEFSGDWSAWSGCVSTTNAKGWMPCLALPPW